MICTITNDDDPGSLQLRKRVVNDNGGTATVSNFNVTSDAGAQVFDGGVADGANTILYTATALQVAAGQYTLREDDLMGYTEGTWSCTGATPDNTSIDFGAVTVPLAGSVVCTITNDDKPASISGYKYLDSGNDGDGDGLPDAGDTPIGGWDISLFESDGGGGWNLVATQTTAGDGSYSFDNLPPGDYLVCEELQANFIESYPLNTDCVAVGATYEPGGYAITLATGEDSTNNNFFNTGEIFGCTPGYWKNHQDRWGATYAPGDLVTSVFSTADNPGSDTLLDALQYRGGPGVAGGRRILLRAAVSSLLNFSSAEFLFLVPELGGLAAINSEAELIAAVNAALASNDRGTMLSLATQLDEANNAVNSCPLGGTRAYRAT